MQESSFYASEGRNFFVDFTVDLAQEKVFSACPAVAKATGAEHHHQWQKARQSMFNQH